MMSKDRLAAENTRALMSMASEMREIRLLLERLLPRGRRRAVVVSPETKNLKAKLDDERIIEILGLELEEILE